MAQPDATAMPSITSIAKRAGGNSWVETVSAPTKLKPEPKPIRRRHRVNPLPFVLEQTPYYLMLALPIGGSIIGIVSWEMVKAWRGRWGQRRPWSGRSKPGTG